MCRMKLYIYILGCWSKWLTKVEAHFTTRLKILLDRQSNTTINTSSMVLLS